MNLQLWVQDHRWAGAIVVVSATEAGARELMSAIYTYDPNRPLESYEIQEGLMVYNLGDS